MTKKKNFITVEELDEQLEMQQQLNAAVLSNIFSLSKENVNSKELEFFFYTNEIDKANNLVIELYKFGYKIYGIDNNSLNGEFCIKGLTTHIEMDDEIVTNWSEQMCKLAFDNDCRFDGWGTLI